MDNDILSNAIEALELRGRRVTNADLPGLFDVQGHGELTSGQVIDLARQLREQDQR